MQKFLSQVPVGVWAGAFVVLLAAWTRDGWGMVLGAVVIVATAITTGFRPEEDDEQSPDGDGTGTPPGDDQSS